MTSSGPTSFSETTMPIDNDSVESFKLFLDIVTPPEFSRLLRARVKHLLKTWPPQGASTVSSTSSPTLTPSSAYSPSFEAVRGFAAFFRTQDSTGPSPIDLAATTSLQALHHHLLALQTLLSFLSARELQDIVRARLSESGKDRSAAVQGLMDVMRDPGSEDKLEQLVGKGHSSLVGDIRGSDNDGETVEDVDHSLMPTGEVPPSNISAAKRKVHSKSHVDMDTEADGEASPPKKRQCSENETGDRLVPQLNSQNPSDEVADTSTQTTLPPVPEFPLSDASASASVVVAPSTTTENSDLIVVQSNSNLDEQPPSKTDKDALPVLDSQAASEPQLSCDTKRENSVVENHEDIKVDVSDLEFRASTNVLQTSDVEDEGLVVMLIEEDTARRGPQVVSSPPKVPLPMAQEEPVSSDVAPVPVAVPLTPTSNPRPGEEKSSPSAPFDADLEVGHGSGVSLAEWNRKRFRAALGLPPKEPEKVLEDTTDAAATTTVNNASVLQEEKHSNVDHTSPRLAKVSETASIDLPEIATLPTNYTQDTPSTPARPHTPATTLHAGFPISRSPTPSLRGSNCGSPPGPILRAVDWERRPEPEELDSDMEIDELDELDGSEDTLAIGTGVPYTLAMNAEGVLKPATYTGGFPYRPVSMAGWQSIDGAEGRMWDHVDPKSYDNGVIQDGDLTQNQGVGATDSQQKLFIRLPARGSKGDAGMMSTGTDASASASGSASPSPQPPSYRLVPVSGVDYDRMKGTGKDDEQTLGMQRPTHQSSLGSGPPSSVPHASASSGSVADASSRPPSHGQSQAPSSSHTPNPMHGAVPHGHRLPPGAHPQSYPPHPGYPWYGAMFYVPFAGGPPLHHAQGPGPGHPPSHMFSPTHMQQMSPMSGGSKSGGENGRSPHESEGVPVPGSGSEAGSMGGPGMMAAGSSESSPHVPPPEGPRRAFKRRFFGGEAGDPMPEVQAIDPSVRYTDEVGVKESAKLKRFCFNCRAVQAPSWRKSKLNVGKILCNKCGIYESTHLTARPLKTRPRRSNMEGPAAKKRKNSFTKLAPALSS